MKTEYILLKETILTNNCPECYSTESLILSFKQKKALSKLMIKTDGSIIEHMSCTKCETTIFPGRWTDDIERVYNYHKKTINTRPPSIQFTSLFFLLLFIVLLLVIAGSAYLFYPEIFRS